MGKRNLSAPFFINAAVLVVFMALVYTGVVTGIIPSNRPHPAQCPAPKTCHEELVLMVSCAQELEVYKGILDGCESTVQTMAGSCVEACSKCEFDEEGTDNAE